jgi:hypothetical protein
MARLLISKTKICTFAIVAVICTLLLEVQSVVATQYNSIMTGYAFGNQNGASGLQVYQGDFANHPPTCLNSSKHKDPSGSWSWNSAIHVSSPTIYLNSSNGNRYQYTTFYLVDNGDLYCAQPDYWVDIYFGRYTQTISNCNCPGSPSPGYCIWGIPNNCTDATAFGRNSSTYTH